MCPKFNITVKLKKIFAEILFIIFVRPRIKIEIFIKVACRVRVAYLKE